jgi:hypothetical protein
MISLKYYANYKGGKGLRIWRSKNYTSTIWFLSTSELKPHTHPEQDIWLMPLWFSRPISFYRSMMCEGLVEKIQFVKHPWPFIFYKTPCGYYHWMVRSSPILFLNVIRWHKPVGEPGDNYVNL